MAFDLDMIRGIYTRMQERAEAARKVAEIRLTLTKKILNPRMLHLTPSQIYGRAKQEVSFAPVRIAYQDSEVQRSLL